MEKSDLFPRKTEKQDLRVYFVFRNLLHLLLLLLTNLFGLLSAVLGKVELGQCLFRLSSSSLVDDKTKTETEKKKSCLEKFYLSEPNWLELGRLVFGYPMHTRHKRRCGLGLFILHCRGDLRGFFCQQLDCYRKHLKLTHTLVYTTCSPVSCQRL